MLSGILKPCARAAHLCLRCAVSFVIWSVWLALLILLAGQAYVASVNRLAVPGFLLRTITERLAVSGMTVTFGSATFDPTGRILVENARIKLASFNEPIATARAIYTRINPFALLAGRFEPLELRVTGVNFLVPAMLSSSGRAEEIVRDLDAGLTPQGEDLRVDYLSCRLGTVALSARGAIRVGEPSSKRTGPLPVAEFVSRNYAPLSKEFSHAIERMSAFDQPDLHVVLTPSATRTAFVRVTLHAAGFSLGGSAGVHVNQLTAVSRFPLLGRTPTTTGIDVRAGAMRGPQGVSAEQIRAHVDGLFDLDAMSFEPRSARIAAAYVATAGVRAVAPVVRLVVDGGSAVRGSAAARILGRTVTISGGADWKNRTADLRFDASVAPGAIGLVSEKIGHDLGTFVQLSEPAEIAGTIRLEKGWRLAAASARFSARNVLGHRVRLDEVRGRIDYDGKRLHAPNVYARIGENFARGSFDQDVATGDHRFLLMGRLRPLEITPWFGEWWARLFGNFEFPAGPLSASVDVHGRWGQKALQHSSQFVYAHGPLVIRGVAFDGLNTRLFIRPTMCDALEFSLSQGAASARGTFTLRSEAGGSWRGLDIAIASSLAPEGLSKMLGPGVGDILSHFSFSAAAPELALSGHFDGPAAPEPRHARGHVSVRSPGPMRYYGIAFGHARFVVDWHDDDLVIDGVEAGFGGGTLDGKASLAGKGADRTVVFSAKLADATLGSAVTGLGDLALPGVGDSAAAKAAFARDKSGVRLDLSASAQGRAGDAMSYHGAGTVQFQGPDLGRLPLLGGLSKLLQITSLRFTNAQSAFKIDGPSLGFEDLTVTGANSAIRAHGTYAMDRRQLDFSAKVYPFLESKSFMKLFDVLSKPLSEVLEVRLSGTVDKPSWSFVYGPFNLLRPYQPGQPAPPSPLAHPPQ